MGEHEARLRAMIAPDQLSWDLSANDEAAIRWALDAIGKLKVERDEIRKEYCQFMHNSARSREAIVPLLEQARALLFS